MKKPTFRIIWKYLILEIAAVLAVLIMVGRGIRRTMEYDAQIYGETIASNIQLTLNEYLNITESLKMQYLEYGNSFRAHFAGVCSRIMEKDDVIGSMYLAPGGVILQAYPAEVNAATIGFEPAKDPEQGPLTRLAIETRKTTVAGPHALVEGGTGFIIRNPIFDGKEEEGDFRGFIIIVMDWDRFIERITDVQGSTSGYNYAVWKDDLSHVLADDDGYIFKSGQIRERRIDIPVEVPNDVWHLTAEPASGWSIQSRMIPWYLGAALFLIALQLIQWSFIRDRQSKRELAYERAASAAKSTFLFNMSHDIRTPMNAVIGFTRLALDHEREPELIHDYLTKILESGNHLLTLINDILEMSRIESGKIQLREEPCDLRDLLRGIESMMAGQAREKHQHFELNTEKLRFPGVYGDRLRINQILLNLLSNAVKFTPEGGSITMTVEQEKAEHHHFLDLHEEDSEQVFCIFRVRDTGIGMSEEFAKKIYDSFERENTSTVSGTQGTGLGMAITKRLVDLMGGTIDLTTAPGKGTEFVVTLPLRIAEPAQNKDNSGNIGGTAAAAAAGQSSGARAETGQDFQFEGGRDTGPGFRTETGEQKPLREKLAQENSGQGRPAREKPLQEKPAQENSGQGQPVQEKPPGQKPAQEKPLQGRKILLAEDILVNRLLAVELLRSFGAEVEEAENGKEALDKISGNRAGTFDAVLMDIQMPVMDGHAATRAIRALGDPALSRIPIIAMTANAFEEDRKAAFDAGMNAHLAKPIDPEEMLRVLLEQVE